MSRRAVKFEMKCFAQHADDKNQRRRYSSVQKEGKNVI